MSNYVIIFGCVLVVAIGQLLFKLVGLRMGARGFDILLEDYKSAALFLTALVFYGASTLGWVLALRQVPLSTAYLFMSMSFVLVPVGAWYFLNETLDVRTLAGSALIISGIALASSG
ncbi:MAG: EamA family transporter [Pseudomonadota bacterium]